MCDEKANGEVSLLSVCCNENAKLWFRVDQEMTSWQTGLGHILPGRAGLLNAVSRLELLPDEY